MTTVVEITGSMLRAGRILAGLSQEDLAQQAGISRPRLTVWEGSSNEVPNARAPALGRIVSVLESEGIHFIEGGVQRVQPPPARAATRLR